MRKLVISYILTLLSSFALCQEKLYTVRGIVVEYNSREPIENAAITFIGENVTVISEEDGSFVAKGITSGYHSAYIFAYGYEPRLTESFLVNQASSPLEFKLRKREFEIEEVVVIASPLRTTIESPLSTRRVSLEEIDLTPGANRDISKVVQLSPGVVPVSFNNRNDIIARGGGADENKYYLDGIEIPLLNHFAVAGGSGGYASLINTELLGSVNFYTGAFPTEYNNGVSSILDMTMKKGNEEKLHAKAVIGASDMGLTIDTPISRDSTLTLIASFRRSYLQLLFSALELPFLPTYNDFQFKLNKKIDKNRDLYVIGIGSYDKNKLNLSLSDLDDSQRYILGYLPNNNQSSYLFGIGYRQRFSGGISTTTISHSNVDNLLYKYKDNDPSQELTMDIDSKEREYKIRSEVKLYNLGRFDLKAGVGGGYGDVSSQIYLLEYASASYNTTDITSKVDIFRYSIYANASTELISGKLSGSLGFRLDGMNYSELTSNPLKQFSPRATLSYTLTQRMKVVASAGRYYQEPSYTSMSIESNQERLKYMAVNSFALGMEHSPDINSKLKVEGFYKLYSNTPISLVDSLPITTSDFESSIVGAVPTISSGAGRSYGLELSYRNLDFKNSIINISYTYMHAEQNRLDDNLQPIKGEYMVSSWDIRHIVNMSIIHKLPNNWSIGAKWYLVSGVPYTPYDEVLSSLITAWDAQNRPYTDTSKYNAYRSESYHQLDLRVDKVWYFDKWRLGFYMDIQNVYINKSRDGDLLIPESDANGNYIVDPNDNERYLMKSIESYYGGTILPTIGITIEI